MAVVFNPYLNFPGKTKEAMEFYQGIFGGELTTTTFKDGGMPTAPEEENFLMHAQLKADDVTVMAADSTAQMPFNGYHGFGLSLTGEAADEDKLRGYWDKLTAGGTVTMPLSKAPWGDTFGMFNDKFGIGWMVNITQPVS